MDISEDEGDGPTREMNIVDDGMWLRNVVAIKWTMKKHPVIDEDASSGDDELSLPGENQDF